jgi:AbrB family looped-hinge helix DNA binding protein
MITTMDAAGRVVLPKALRNKARLQPGAPLDVRVVDGRIEIEPAAAVVTVEKRQGFWVATPSGTDATLTLEQVNDTLDTLRVPADHEPDTER